jgi:hypothetical protein
MLLSNLNNKVLQNLIRYIFILFIILLSACNISPVLNDTVLSMKEVKGIGELITAEYYGEVISSFSLVSKAKLDTNLKEAYVLVQNSYRQVDTVINNKYAPQINDYKEKIAKLEEKKTNAWRESRISDLKGNLKDLNSKINRKKIKQFKSDQSQQVKSAMQLLTNATGANKRTLLDYMLDNTLEYKDINDKYLNKVNNFRKKLEDNKELVYIGRGSVKAGYDLEQLDSFNIFYSPKRDTMYLFDFDPIITDLDINPYFYYPEDVDSSNKLDEYDTTMLYGFQLIYSSNERDVTLQDINNVKSECKRKLYQEALDRNIFQNAQRNAELALSGLFGLLSTEGEIKEVIISHSKYFSYQVDYLYDKKIDMDEFHEINAIVTADKDSLDEIAFKYQTLKYQLKYLDKFMLDLYKQTRGNNNVSEWDSLCSKYLYDRKIALLN